MTSSTTERLAKLVVDQSDTFFFDHPLDHVPGILLVNAVLELAEKAEADVAGGDVPGRIRLDLRFTKICDLGRATTLSCIPASDGWDWKIVAVQDDYEVCTAKVGFDRCEPLACASGEASAEPAPADLVHRRRHENVLVGEVVRSAGATIEAHILPPPDGHVFRGIDPEFRTPVEITEAGRQFTTMLAHAEAGLPMDARMLWLALTLDVPNRIRRGVPLLLRSIERLNPGHRTISTMLLVEAATGAELGRLDYRSHNMDPAFYARIRSA